MRVLLISTYELGHQPLHVASPAAALCRAGHEVRCLDLSVQPWDSDALEWAQAVGFSVPMHTAMRLALSAGRRVRREHPGLPICFYGLYATVSRELVTSELGAHMIAGEYEPALTAWVNRLMAPGAPSRADPTVHLQRGTFELPARELLPGLERYARLVIGGEGDPGAVFVFQVGSALTTAVNSHVNLIGGAQAGNVFWQVGSSATLGTSSTFAGTILALTSISVDSGVTLDGRALARNGAVTLIDDTINAGTVIDRTPPAFGAISGSLYDHRNQTADHRQEGLYASAFHLTVPATDSQSGVQSIAVQLHTTTGTFVANLASVDQTNSAPGAGLTLDTDLTIPTTVADGNYNVVATATDRAGNAQTQTFTVTLARAGDIYHATLLSGDPSTGGQAARQEWFEYGTQNARAVASDSIKTRSNVPCEFGNLPLQTCAQVRDENPGASSYSAITGASATDPRIAGVTQLYGSDLLAGVAYASQSSLTGVLQPWQHAPPAHGLYADKYTATSPGGLTATIWIDDTTRLPVQIDAKQPDGTTSTSYVDYDVARKLSSQEPADLFAVAPPSPASMTQTQTYTGAAAPGSTHDLATNSNFLSYFLGNTVALGSRNLCLATSDIVNETYDASDNQATPTGPSTVSNSYYANGSCIPGSGQLSDAPLLVATTTQASPTAQAWRGAIRAGARAIQSDPTDESYARGGVISVSVAGVQRTAYLIPLDDTREGFVIDIGNTTVQVIGTFAKADVTALLTALVTH